MAAASLFCGSATAWGYTLTVGAGQTQSISDESLYIASGGGQGWINNSGTLTITGGSSIRRDYGIARNATGSGSTGTISNIGSGTLSISGGSYMDAYGININAGWGGIGTISNTGSGTLSITGGSASYAYGIYQTTYGVGTTSKIRNTGSGTLTIAGGSYYSAHGIAYNGGYDGTATISNDGGGKLTIMGSSTSSAYGIQYNSYGSAKTTGTISNTSWGTLTITGGSYSSAYGIYRNAYESNTTGKIRNTGSGTLIITGGSGTQASGIYINDYFSGTGTISNDGSGKLTIMGSSSAAANGIEYNAYGSLGIGTISNTLWGTLTITGGSHSSASGINYNAYAVSNYAGKSDTTGTISNTGSGTLTIAGGTGTQSYGIGYNAYDSGSTGTISNTSSGTLSITGGSSPSAYGIYCNATGSGNGTISNGVKGTLNILGNKETGSYGIGALSSSDGSSSLLENAGVMNLNTNAIKQFVSDGTPTSVSVVNRSTGTVNAEAGALFSGSYESNFSLPTPIDIVVFGGAGTELVQTESFKNGGGNTTTGTVTLKDDWKKYSTWEDGGTINFTDVVAGSDVANQITQQFQAAFGTGTTINFTATGGSEGGSTASSDFTMDVVTALKNEGKLADGSIITSEELKGTGALDVDSVLAMTTGFKGVSGFDSVTVGGGRTFTLVGASASMAMAVRADRSNATYQVADAPVTVKDASTLKLGIEALSGTQGYMQSVALEDEGSMLSVENGVFDIETVSGVGQVQVKEKGTLTVGSISASKMVNAGSFEATGEVRLENAALLQTLSTSESSSDATFLNEKGATATFTTLDMGKGTKISNKGTLTADSMTTDAVSVVTNFPDAMIDVDTFVVQGTLRNLGTIQAGDFTVGSGSTASIGGTVKAKLFTVARVEEAGDDASTDLTITGSTFSDELDLAGGAVTVADGATLAGVKLKGASIGSQVKVEQGGTFAFSFTENGLKDAMEKFTVSTDGRAVAVLNTDLNFAEGGSLTVGTTEATDTVNLGSDALVLLSTTDLHGEAMLTGSEGDTLKVDAGAELAFTDNSMWGNHYLVKGFEDAGTLDNLTIMDKDGNVLEAHVNDSGIYVTIGGTDIREKDKGYGLIGNINAILDGRQDTASENADVAYLSQAVTAKDGASQTVDLERLAAESGAAAETLRLAQNAHGAMMDHALSVKSGNVWVQALAGKGSASTGGSDYDVDSYGILFGLDGRVADWGVGLAFHYNDGSVDADSSATESDLKVWGTSIYASKLFESGVNLALGLSYGKGSHDITQKNLMAASADADVTTWIAGARLSYPFEAKGFVVAPYAGLEAVRVEADGFDVKLAGKSAFRYSDFEETFARIPLGVRLWTAKGGFAGFADLSIAPQFGNTEARQTISGVTTGASDAVAFDFADSLLGELKLGAEYRLGTTTSIGLTYGASLGDVRDLSHDFMANLRVHF